MRVCYCKIVNGKRNEAQYAKLVEPSSFLYNVLENKHIVRDIFKLSGLLGKAYVIKSIKHHYI